MRQFLYSILICGLLTGCQEAADQKNAHHMASSKKPVSQVPLPSEANDPHTFAQPKKARVSHLKWKADLDFDRRVIKGDATWKIEVADDATHIYFDSKKLNIKEVYVDGEKAEFEVSEPTPHKGSYIQVPINAKSKQVRFVYETSSDAAALLWIEKEKTADKTHPFLFTQSQAILARSWIPCQDSPGIRFTYEAEVSAPEGMLVLMSATNPTALSKDNTYQFEMTQPIPAYLMALSAGNLIFTPIGESTGIYTEPSLKQASAYEFAELDKMLKVAEGIYGKYRWERYDLLILPPSFPFGGMENPRLTFVTPTIIAGDRSLTSLIAHELAHSWSGNLVTNATWDDFWLNEGFTVYFERRIMEGLYGRDYSEMLALLGYQDLKETVEELNAEGKRADTHLKLDLEGRDPDDGMTDIAYEKGYFMLRLLEEKVGREKFDKFLNAYFDEFAFRVMTTEYFLQYLNENLIESDTALIRDLRLNEWVYGSGLPDNLPVPQSDRFEKVESFLADYLKGNVKDLKVTESWTSHEWLHFLRAIPNDVDLKTVRQLDIDFGFTESENSEMLAAWFQTTIRSDYKAADEKMKKFLIQVGRRKFLTPTYDAFLDAGKKAQATAIYQQARPNYHSVATQTMDELLKYSL